MVLPTRFSEFKSFTKSIEITVYKYKHGKREIKITVKIVFIKLNTTV